MASMFLSTSSSTSSVRSCISSPTAYRGQEFRRRSTAPFVKSHCLLVSLFSKMTDIFFTSESNGNSATCCHWAFSPVERRRRFQLNREANTWMAISVGSPRPCHSPFNWFTVARLASEAMLRYSLSVASLVTASVPSIGSPSASLSRKLMSLGWASLRPSCPTVGLKGSLVVPTEYVPRPGIHAFLTIMLP
ncbi:hypothetical protein J3458_022568 [Metarhizium acridum]|uniref:uncharacterized protein n=1 Tax=Metarhizium acridum TaxID=92637 RepID=UPI001C6CE0E6|nr:hypothetical protein J3458_022568 [Metarhizium acridum]